MDTQNVREVGAAPRHKGGARLLGRCLKLCGEAGEELLAKKSIGRGHLGDACESQFFGEPILERPEHALGAAPGLRRICGNERDPQLLQSTMHLRQPALVHVAPGLVGVPVVGAPVRIERTEEPLRLNDLAHAL